LCQGEGTAKHNSAVARPGTWIVTPAYTGGMVRVTLRFYAELNDFLPPPDRSTTLVRDLPAPASVKEIIEAHGVPHTEVDLLLVNGEPVDFRRVVRDGDRVAVYPVFEAFDVASVTRVRPHPLRETRFILDVHLGRLARYLRLAGFDAGYATHSEDAELARNSAEQRRILLTRDQGLLKRREVTHGYYVRETRPARQLAEVIRRFDLRAQVRPFTRCTCCNGTMAPIAKAEALGEVPERSGQCFDDFLRCGGCRRIYWRGSHVVRFEQALARALDDVG
jgi:uncharacterized protein with PIN domain